MLKIFYTLLFFGYIAAISGCGDPSSSSSLPDTVYEPKPAVSHEELSRLRAAYAAKVKIARDATCKDYDERDSLPISYPYALFVLRERAKNRNSSHALNDPLERHSSILCALERRDNQPVFMPRLAESGAGYDIRYPADELELDSVIDSLRAGFVLGHSMVGLMLSSSGHQIMGAFRDNGEFYIVDSMGGGIINAQKFADALNQAAILDKKGFPIKFFGRSIGTRLQKGGNDCIRLAALYLRQILKDNDLNAYQKVNGAFVDNILQRFEDIALIDTARKIDIVESIIDTQRHQFMYSWDHRNHSMFHDTGFHGIKIGDLKPQSAGGKELERQGKYILWTNFNGNLWSIGLKRKCNLGVKFCRKTAVDTPVFSTRLDDLTDIRNKAANPLNQNVVAITNLDDTLGRLMDTNTYRIGIIYFRDVREFYAITLDNAFISL